MRDETGILEVLDASSAAWAANDADAFADLYGADGVVVLAGGTYLRGREEIRAYMKAGFAGRLKDTRAVDEPEQIRLLGGDAAQVVGKSWFLLPGETEPAASRLRRAAYVLTLQDDRWWIESYVNSPLDLAA